MHSHRKTDTTFGAMHAGWLNWWEIQISTFVFLSFAMKLDKAEATWRDWIAKANILSRSTWFDSDATAAGRTSHHAHLCVWMMPHLEIKVRAHRLPLRDGYIYIRQQCMEMIISLDSVLKEVDVEETWSTGLPQHQFWTLGFKIPFLKPINPSQGLGTFES